MSSDRARDAAFEDFVAAAGQDLGRLAWILTLDQEDAAELVQEALARTYARWTVIRNNGGDDPFPYVRRTLVNLRTDRWRRRGRRHDAETLWSARPERAVSDWQELRTFDVAPGTLRAALAR